MSTQIYTVLIYRMDNNGNKTDLYSAAFPTQDDAIKDLVERGLTPDPLGIKIYTDESGTVISGVFSTTLHHPHLDYRSRVTCLPRRGY